MAQLTELIGQQTVAIEQLSETMSGITSVMENQLESLKSIARWQDQTALYTSHLQNIKIDLNQIRKWGENINHIADRIDVLANQEDAERQEDLSGGDQDGVPLSTDLLQQIANNTERTAIAVEQMASVQAEPFEDKRTETSKPISRREQKSKGSGQQGELTKAVGTAGTFLGEVFKGFLALGALVGSVLLAPTSFFETTREFFGKLKGLFNQLMGFFVNDVAPVISFLFEELLGFFNRLAPELSELGAALGESLREIGPQIWATVGPVLAFIADGILKTVDMLTDGLEKLPDAVSAFGKFMGDIIEMFFDPEGKYDTHLEAINAFFAKIGNFFSDLVTGDFMTNFRGTLMAFWNAMIDLLNLVLAVVVDAYNLIAPMLDREQIDPDDYFIDRSFNVQNTDLSAELVDMVLDQISQGRTPKEAIDFVTSDKVMMQLLEGEYTGYETDHRIPEGLEYEKSDTLGESGRYLLASGQHAERTNAILTQILENDGMSGLMNLYTQRYQRLASGSLQEQAATYVPAGAVKYKQITGIHDALPMYAGKYGIPDTIIVTDDVGKGVYDHFYHEDGRRQDLPDEFIRSNLTHLINQMDNQSYNPASNNNTTTSTIVLSPNAFGAGTGSRISGASVDNRFVLDPAVHGNQQPRVNVTAAGSPVVTNLHASQVEFRSGSGGRNNWLYKKE